MEIQWSKAVGTLEIVHVAFGAGAEQHKAPFSSHLYILILLAVRVSVSRSVSGLV